MVYVDVSVGAVRVPVLRRQGAAGGAAAPSALLDLRRRRGGGTVARLRVDPDLVSRVACRQDTPRSLWRPDSLTSQAWCSSGCQRSRSTSTGRPLPRQRGGK